MDSVEELDQLGIREVLDQDSRPAFILDLDPDEERLGGDSIHPIFCNAALRLHERLFDAVTQSSGQSYIDFRNWATGVTKHDDSKDSFPLSFVYADLLWMGSTVRQRWRFISGNLLWKDSPPTHDLSSGAPAEVAAAVPLLKRVDTMSEQPSSLSQTESSAALRTASSTKYPQPPLDFSKTSESNAASGNSSQSIILASPDSVAGDWTLANPKGLVSSHVQLVRSIDWALTSIGAMRSWSPEFRQVVRLVMGNPHPAALFWGSDLTMVYNEAYALEVAGSKHPQLMGCGFSGPFSEVWDGLAPLFAECARTGIAIRREIDYLPIERHGFLEETFFSWSFTPLYGGSAKIIGFYNAPFEMTQVERNRRMLSTINTLGDFLSRAKTVKQFWKHLLEGLEMNPFDFPFALLYSVGDGEEGELSSVSSGSTMSLKSCYYEGSLGIPKGHIAAPQQLDLKRSLEGFIPSFREAMRTREPTLLHTRDGTLPQALLDGIQWRGFGEPSREAIIFPLRPTNGDQILAFLLLGVNPRRPYDESYKSFVSTLNRTLATSLASCMLFEEEVKRSRDAAEEAALEQAKLSQQLELQTDRLRRMTELSLTGMFLISPEGILREANDQFYETTSLHRDDTEPLGWMDCVTECSSNTIVDGWHLLVHDHLPFSGEVQLKKPAVRSMEAGAEEPMDSWVLFTAQPEFSKDSSLRSIMGSITDISHLKWAQGLQNRRLQEAEETRRQQNEFIDITSHEMRNPLSAILQCADDISSVLEEDLRKGVKSSKENILDCVDAAYTISLCVQHQKAIVDDILTISKLDSNLLLITPIPTQPFTILKRAIRMVDPELQAKDIRMVSDVHSSFQDYKIDWVAMDPSRVLQILINLLTNAIKFTAGSAKRIITVAVGVSTSEPFEVNQPDFDYVPISKRRNDRVTEPEDWGTGEVIYLRFKVADTGCGLTHDEKHSLFERFKQASPRTHAQYGGSGLGLFISKQLSELHGGSIGVASEAGVGSVFGFYIKARRCPPPTSPLDTGIYSPRDSVEKSRMTTQVNLALRQNLEEPAGNNMAIVTFDPTHMHILVVEDNLINQKVLVKQLKKFGCTVAVANDGIEALEVLAETRYCKTGGKALDVVLMDLEMPRMNGLDCVRRIREMQADGSVVGHVPVIAVTANVRDEQKATARKSGMDEVVSKPFTIPDLFKKVEVVLRTLGSG